MTPREYTLLLTRSQKLALWVPMVMFTVFPILFFFIFHTLRPAADGPDAMPPFFPLFPLGVFLALGVFHAWSVLSLPNKISVTRDRKLVFKSMLRTQAVRVADVQAIAPHSTRLQAGLSGYMLKHREGKIRFTSQFTDQYLLLYELKQENPSVELKGC